MNLAHRVTIQLPAQSLNEAVGQVVGPVVGQVAHKVVQKAVQSMYYLTSIILVTNYL